MNRSLTAIAIALTTVVAAPCLRAQTSTPECLDSAWSALRRSAPPTRAGYALHRSYTITKIARRRDGFDTSRVRYDIVTTEGQFHLVTDLMEVHSDERLSIMILPGQRVITLTPVSAGRIPETWAAVPRPIGDSLLAGARNVLCRDTVLADGRREHIVSFDLAEERQSTTTARGMTIVLGDRSYPDRVVTTYMPGSEFVRSEIEIDSVEYLPERPELRRPVLSLLQNDSAGLRPEYEGYRIIDDR